MCESDYLRSLINDYLPKEKPPVEFFYMINEFRKIGNNVNQIAKIANQTSYIDEKLLYIIPPLGTLLYKYLKPDKRQEIKHE